MSTNGVTFVKADLKPLKKNLFHLLQSSFYLTSVFAFHENVNQPVFFEIDTFAEKLSISRCFGPIRSFRFRPKLFFAVFILFCSSAFSRNRFDRSFLLFNVNDWNASAAECPAVSASAPICQAAKSAGQSVDPRMFRQQRPLKLESGQTIFINSTKIASSRNFFRVLFLEDVDL